MHRSCLLACVVALGCGGSGGKTRPAPPTHTAEPAPAPAAAGAPSDDEIRAIFVELAEILDRLSARSTEPCADLATAIHAEADQHAAMFERATQLAGDAEQRADRIFDAEGYEAKVDRAAAGFYNAIDRCDADPAFHGALERFGTLLDGSSKAAP